MAVTLTAVRQLPGTTEVTGDLSAETLIVTFDPALVSQQQIADAVEALGYTVKETFQP